MEDSGLLGFRSVYSCGAVLVYPDFLGPGNFKISLLVARYLLLVKVFPLYFITLGRSIDE